MKEYELIELVKRVQSLSQIGLTYAVNEYDMDRYVQLQQIGHSMLQILTDKPVSFISGYFSQSKEYITPKVDIRAVVFNEKKEILLVKEKADGLWSLPGGWADIGFSPGEVAAAEVKEETGLDVVPQKLLAVLDKKCHPHPPEADYVYKFFIQCKLMSLDFNKAFDILDKGFFAKDAMPPLSLNRVLPAQIDLMFEYLNEPLKPATID